MNKKDIKKYVDGEKRRMKEIQEREEFQARCDHKIEKKGRVVAQLKEKPGADYCVCKICGAHIDFEPISQKEISQAAATLERALQQFKVLSDDAPGKVLDDIAFAIQVADRLENIYAPIRKELVRKGDDGFVSDDDMTTGNYYASSNYPLLKMDGKKHKHKKDYRDKDYRDKDKKKHKNKDKKHSSNWLY